MKGKGLTAGYADVGFDGCEDLGGNEVPGNVWGGEVESNDKDEACDGDADDAVIMLACRQSAS